MSKISSARGALALASILLVLTACGRDPAVSPSAVGAAAPVPIVVALGDSLTAGPGLRPEETYPALLQERLRSAGYRHRVVNAGVSGDTSADALRRLDAALVPDTAVLIVAVGANDGLRAVPVATVSRNVGEIITRAQARTIKVLLCGMETPPVNGWQYTVDFHKVFPDLATTHGVPLMPFLLWGVAGRPEYNLGDGVHPNAAGMRIIAQTMWPYLEPLLR
jgi:acyl-CoA thioesterase-1